MMRIMKITASILLGIFIVLFFFRPLEIEDGWWHLSVGRWIVNHGQVPHFDVFSSNGVQVPWTFTQWLGSALYYEIYVLGGYWGLLAYRAFLFIVIIAIFFSYSYRRVPLSLLLLLSFLLAYGIKLRCLLRPDIYNFIFIQLFLIVLLNYWNGPKRRRLWLIPLMGIVWNNLHLGSFIYGGILLFISVFSSFIEGIKQKQSSPEGAGHFTRFQDLLMISFVYLLTFFVNPYGWEAFLYPWKVFLLPAHINVYRFMNTVNEALPPIYLLSLYGVTFFILIFLSVASLLFAKRHKFTFILLFIVSLFTFLYGNRNAPFFVLVALYIIVECARQNSFLTIWKSYRSTQKVDLVLFLLSFILLTAHSLNLFNQKIYLQNHFVRELKLQQSPYCPMTALKVMKENHIKGFVFNWESYGSYILWFGYPGLKPFVDGRQLNQEAFMAYMRTRGNPRLLWPDLDEKFRFKIALLDGNASTNQKIINYLATHPQWQLIMIDGSCLLFVKKGEFALPDDLNNFENNIRSIRVTREDIDRIKSLPLPGFGQRLVQLIFPPPFYIDYLEQGITLSDMGYPEAGLYYVMKAVEISNTDYTRFILTLTIKRYEEASQ